MLKRSDAYVDAIQNATTTGLLNNVSRNTGLHKYVGDIGTTSSNVGSLYGLFERDVPDVEELAEMERNYNGWIPGNAARRTMLRRRMVNKHFGGKPSTVYSEVAGPSTVNLLSMLGGTGLGAITGAMLAGENATVGALFGGIGGLATGTLAGVLANGAGGLAAAVTPTRTDEEQRSYEENPEIWKNYIIPGRAIYNKYKSLGVSNRMLQEYINSQEEKKKKKKESKKDTEKDADMIKKSGSFCKAASYVLCKRAEKDSGKTIDESIQDEVFKSYIQELEEEKNEDTYSDVYNGALNGGLRGASYGLLGGALLGLAGGPVHDLMTASDRTIPQSLGYGVATGGLTGVALGTLGGMAVGAFKQLATRKNRKKLVIDRLRELGVK